MIVTCLPPPIFFVLRSTLRRYCGDMVSQWLRRVSHGALPPLRGHERRLEDDGGCERRQQRQGHQLAHARSAWVMGEPQTPECNGRGAGAEDDGARQARL